MQQKACWSAQTSASGTHLFRLGSGQVSGGILRQAFVARSPARLPLWLLVVASLLMLVACSPARLPLLLLVAALLCLLLAARRCSPSKQLTVAKPPVCVHRETRKGSGPAPRRTSCAALLDLREFESHERTSTKERGPARPPCYCAVSSCPRAPESIGCLSPCRTLACPTRPVSFIPAIEDAAFGARVRGCQEVVHGGIPIQASRGTIIRGCIACADERGREALDAPTEGRESVLSV